MDTRAKEILDYWLGDLSDQSTEADRAPYEARWWGKDEGVDAEIKSRFEDDLKRARVGEFDHWQKGALSSLALVILFDQFPRNMYRGQSRMHANDTRAQMVTIRGIDDGLDQELNLQQRWFYYMPLMHSERLPHHEKAEEVYAKLAAEAREKAPANAEYFAKALEYERKHKRIIERFGRYPHRNNVLGRTFTPQEFDFLKEPDSDFY